MWDGAFKSKKQVSMRGRSARQRERRDFKNDVRRKREERHAEKAQQAASVVIQKVCRSFVVRMVARRQMERQLSAHMQDVKKVADLVVGFKMPAETALRLTGMLAFCFRDETPRRVPHLELLFMGIENAVETEGVSALQAGIGGWSLRTHPFLAISMRMIVTLCDRKELLLVPRICSSARCLLEGDRQRRLRVKFLLDGWTSHRRGLRPTEAMGVLIISFCVDVSLLHVLCLAYGEFFEDMDEDPDLVQDFVGNVLSVSEQALSRIGLEDILIQNFPIRGWTQILLCLHDFLSSSDDAVVNMITNSLRYGRLVAYEKSGSTKSSNERRKFQSAYWMAVARLVDESGRQQLLEEIPEIRQVRDYKTVQDEMYAALVPNVDIDHLLSICSVYETIRHKWTSTTQRTSLQRRSTRKVHSALDSMSPSGIVVSAVAFSPRSNSLVALLWKFLLQYLDSSKSIGGDFFEIVHSDSIMKMLSFTFACTSQLLPALDDEELFMSEKPFKVTELRDMAFFLKFVLYEGIWTQGDPTSPSRRIVMIPETTVQKAAELFDQLFDRHSRHEIMPNDNWLFPPIQDRELGIASNAGVITQSRSELRNTQRFRRPAFPDDEEDDDNDDDDEDMKDAEEGISPAKASERVKRLLQDLPETIPFSQRVLVFDYYVGEDQMNAMQSREFHRSRIRFRVKRSHIYEDAFQSLANIDAIQMKSRFQVEFISHQGTHEAGIDGGGLFKEFLLEFAKQAYDPRLGLWKVTSNQELYPNPMSHLLVDDNLSHFEFIGRMLGKAVYEGILLELNLAPFFLNSILGRRNHLHDLQSLDPEIYKNLLQIKDLDDPSVLDLTFSVTRGLAPDLSDVELVPNGSSIPVTKDNYIHYISRMSNFLVNEEIWPQTHAFLTGFTSVIDLNWLKMFKAHELQLIIGGSDDGYSIKEMRAHCTYSHGYADSDPYIADFWQVISEFDGEQRALFLKFITSCSKPPLQGFGALNPKMCIGKVETANDERLPTASTCVNYLKLPKYSSKQVLCKKLLYAIESSSGFELS